MENHIHCETTGILFGYKVLVKMDEPAWYCFGIQIPSKKLMNQHDKINVQQTLLPIPGMEQTYSKQHNRFRFSQ